MIDWMSLEIQHEGHFVIHEYDKHQRKKGNESDWPGHSELMKRSSVGGSSTVSMPEATI